MLSRKNADMSALIISANTFVFLSLLMPVLVIGTNMVSVSVFLGATLMFYSGLQLSLLIFQRRAQILQLTFWIFIYVFFGFAAVMQLISERFPWPSAYSSEEMEFSLLIVLTGCICYQLGQLIGKRKKELTRNSKFRFLHQSEFLVTNKTLFLVGVATIAMSLIIIATQQSGGLSSLFSARLESYAQFHTDNKMRLLLFIALSHVPVFCVLLVAMMQKKRHKALIAFLIVVNLVINNPISSARYWFGSAFIAMIIALFAWKRWSMFRWVYGFLILLILVFPYADIFRATTNLSEVQLQNVQQLWTDKADFDVYQMTMNVRKFTEREGLSLGRQITGALFFFVPRTIWDDKPTSTGQMVGEYLGYNMTNLSAPLWSEFYNDFGWVGVILGFGIYGYLSRRLETAYLLESHRLSFGRVIVPFLAAYQLFLLRGDLMNAIAYISLFLVTIAGMLLFRSKVENMKKSTDIVLDPYVKKALSHRLQSPTEL